MRTIIIATALLGVAAIATTGMYRNRSNPLTVGGRAITVVSHDNPPPVCPPHCQRPPIKPPAK